MVVRLERYYGDSRQTLSRLTARLEGDDAARLVCHAREPRYVDYGERTFDGVSKCCLPSGRWLMRARCTRFGAMGLRVPVCTGHNNALVGWSWSERLTELGVVYVGEMVEAADGEPAGSGRLTNGREVFERLTELVYVAYARGEEMWLEIDNSGCNAI